MNTFDLPSVFGQTIPDVEIPQQGVSFGSPEAMVQVRDIQIPVSYNTGTVDVQIPLYEFSYGGYRVPIGLSYNTSGIKVDDEPTIVGLGWRLNAGGSIVRVVRGTYPDGYGCTWCRGLLKSNATWSEETFDLRVNNWFDTEPDVYYFSTPTCSGMFVLDDNGSAIQIPYQSVSISAENDSEGGCITIDDRQGNYYTFGQGNDSRDISTQIKMKWNRTYKRYDVDSCSYVSAWHLNRIVHDGNDIANFYYEKSEEACTTEVVNLSKVYSAANTNPGGDTPNYISDLRGEKVYTTTVKVVTRQKFPRQISWETGNIYFDISDRLLREVVMEDVSGKFSTSIRLNYGTFYNGYAKLTGVEEYCCDEWTESTTSIAKFLYNESTALVEDMRRHSDYLGYYNGARAGQEYYISSSLDSRLKAVTYSLISKTPDLKYAQANSLRRIVYPLGGYKEFRYELNLADNKDIDIFVMSGLRVKSITERAYHGADTAVTRYEYGREESYGTLDGLGTCTKNFPVHVTSLSPGGSSRMYYSVSDKCLTALAGMDGCAVQYPIVWEILPDGSKNEYVYTSFENYPDLPADRRISSDASKPWVAMSNGGPITQTTRHYARGLQIWKSSYDNEGDMVAREFHYYALGDVRRSMDVIVPCRGLVEGYRINPKAINSEQYEFCRYKWQSQSVYDTTVTVVGTKYTPGSVTKYTYNKQYDLPERILRIDDAGDSILTVIKYPFNYTVSAGSTDPMLQSLIALKNHKPATPIETVTFRNGVAVEGQLNIYMNEYCLSEQKYLPQEGIPYEDFVFSDVSVSQGFSYDSHYRTDVAYYDYNGLHLPMSFRRRDGNIQSVVYDQGGNVIARIDNALHSNSAATNTVYYSSFETYDTGVFVGLLEAKSGYYVRNEPLTVQLAPIDGNYEVTYWRWVPNDAAWRKVSYLAPGNAGSITISAAIGSVIDEVRIIPSDATIETATYGTNFNKMVTQTDRNGFSAYYEYDGLGRPKAKYDNNLNCVQNYEIDF